MLAPGIIPGRPLVRLGFDEFVLALYFEGNITDILATILATGEMELSTLSLIVTLLSVRS
jgi:hypothetical protein